MRVEADARVVGGEIFGGRHAAADGLVDALDLGHVERARGIADEHRARHLELRHGLPAARGDAARAGGEDFAALEEGVHLAGDA